MAEYGTRPTSNSNGVPQTDAYFAQGHVSGSPAQLPSAPLAEGDKSTGFTLATPPSRKVFNTILDKIGDWLQYMDEGRLRTFSALEDFVVSNANNALGLVSEASDTDALLSVLQVSEEFSNVPVGGPITGDGRYIYIAVQDATGGAGVHKLDRTTLETVASSASSAYGVSSGDGITAICTDGLRVYFAADSDGEIYALYCSDLAVAWTGTSHGDKVNSMDVSGEMLLIAGDRATATGSFTVRNMDATDGSVSASYDTTAIATAVASDGESIWFGGVATASDQILFRSNLDFSTVTSFTDSAISTISGVAIGDSAVFISHSVDSGSHGLTAIQRQGFLEAASSQVSPIWQFAGLDGTASKAGAAVLFDGRLVYLATTTGTASEGEIFLIDPATGAAITSLVYDVDDAVIQHIFSDGFGFYAAFDTDDIVCKRLHINAPATVCRLQDPSSSQYVRGPKTLARVMF